MFEPEKYSLELRENKLKAELQIAEELAKEYVPLVINAIEDVKDVYIPNGNRELLYAAAIFYGVMHNCSIMIEKDLSDYMIKTTAGGEYIAFIELDSKQSDLDYTPTLSFSYWACGDMTRSSVKYPSVYSWSVDTMYSSREGR